MDILGEQESAYSLCFLKKFWQAQRPIPYQQTAQEVQAKVNPRLLRLHPLILEPPLRRVLALVLTQLGQNHHRVLRLVMLLALPPVPVRIARAKVRLPSISRILNLLLSPYPRRLNSLHFLLRASLIPNQQVDLFMLPLPLNQCGLPLSDPVGDRLDHLRAPQPLERPSCSLLGLLVLLP